MKHARLYELDSCGTAAEACRAHSLVFANTDVGGYCAAPTRVHTHSLALGLCRLECTLTHESDSMEPQLTPYYW